MGACYDAPKSGAVQIDRVVVMRRRKVEERHLPVGGSELVMDGLNPSDLEKQPQFRLWVPTYVGHRNCILGVKEDKEFENPQVPVLIQSVEGIRVVLGSHNYQEWHAPDVQIERRPKGWAIFLNPSAGDPSGYVYFLDDGRSFLVSEAGGGAIELICGEEDIPELDDLPTDESRPRPSRNP
jgi:hypothetical protein